MPQSGLVRALPRPTPPFNVPLGVVSGVRDFALPGTTFTSLGNETISLSNVMIYVPFVVRGTITVDAIRCEVTTALASQNIRIGLYAADTSLQPKGAPIIDSGLLSAATTGSRTATGLWTLTPGVYLTAVCGSGVVKIRAAAVYGEVSQLLGSSFGVTASIVRYTRYASFTFGALPTTGPQWNNADALNAPGAADPLIGLRWT